MRSVTPSRARTALVGVAALVLLLGAAGCDSGDDIQGDGDKDAQTADQATDAPPEVSTFVTLQHVGNRLDAVHRERVKDRVAEVVDPFFDGAYLGEFPRSDYTGAFATFTEGAAADAQGDLDIMSNAAIADQIDSAEATKRRVIVNVFAVQGHPKGATAHFYLDFDTTGDLESSMRVRGELYLAKVKGQWKIFGYDVDEAEQR